MLTVQPKIWGFNTEIFNTDIMSVNVLRIPKGGTCSLHTHKSKYNKFYVISGELKLVLKFATNSIFMHPGGEFIVRPGGEFTVHPGQEHRFQAMEPSIVVEIVYTKLDIDDIDRKEPGYKEDCLNSDLWRKI